MKNKNHTKPGMQHVGKNSHEINTVKNIDSTAVIKEGNKGLAYHTIEGSDSVKPILPVLASETNIINKNYQPEINPTIINKADSAGPLFSNNLYDNSSTMAPIRGNNKKETARIRSMRSDHCFKELEVPLSETRPWDEELYATRIATLSMMEDAVEAKNALEITNQKLLEEIAERTRSEKIQQVLYTISNAALTASDLNELISIFRDQLGRLLDTTNFYIAFYDKATGMLSASNVSDEMDSIETWPAEKSLTGLVIEQKKSMLVTIHQIEKLNEQGIINIIGTLPQVWIGVPLQLNGQVTGAFAIQNYHDINAYTARDMDMLEFISNQISISIERKKSMQDLKAALQKAEENDRLKTAFLHNISHEIRTPMNAIIGFSGFLNEPDLKPADMHEYTEIICNASHQLLSIIEDIINISTVEAGQETLQTRETNLNLLLRNLDKQFQTKIITSDIELHLNTPLPEEVALIITDETKLMQILTNLVNNACKFTKKGLVSFGYILKGGNLEFYVEDTGIGIAQNMHDAVFDRFRQADSTIAREFGGTGLGLSISKAYVELLGGKIWLTSKVGSGTTLYFSIPFKPVNSIYETAGFTPDVEIIIPDNQKVILIAEDEKYNYLLLNEMLKGMNANIIWAHNGMEVLEACKTQQKIDLVLMDLKMPVMDGFEATQIIRSYFPDIPIIAQTAYTSEKERLRIFECGCNDIITKPFDANQFKTIINKYLSVSAATPQEMIHPDNISVRPLY